MRHPSRNRRGWFLMDAIFAMGIIVLLAAVLASAVSRQRKGSDRLAASREAIRLAEQTITALQIGQSAPTAPEGATIEILPISSPKEVPGFEWVTIRVTRDGRKSELIGLVRASRGGTP
jgi:type II secretory pathway pseudopilin PulG